MTPIERLGHSIFIYDITRSTYSHQWLAHNYFISRKRKARDREVEKCLQLDPENVLCQIVRSFAWIEKGKQEQGLNDFHRALTQGAQLSNLVWQRIQADPRSRKAYQWGFGALESFARERGKIKEAEKASEFLKRSKIKSSYY